MSSSKRLIFLFSLLGMNVLFSIQDLSFAAPSSDSGMPIVAPVADAKVADGAVVANSTMPTKAPEILQVQSTEEKIKKVMRFAVTTYTSRVGETDDTPFETALGTRTRPGVAASNVLPFGTKFRIPSVFGDQVFTIEDRMNSRYDGKRILDIWLSDYSKAEAFGLKHADIEILN